MKPQPPTRMIYDNAFKMNMPAQFAQIIMLINRTAFEDLEGLDPLSVSSSRRIEQWHNDIDEACHKFWDQMNATVEYFQRIAL